jgi:hypothetical protein
MKRMRNPHGFGARRAAAAPKSLLCNDAEPHRLQSLFLVLIDFKKRKIRRQFAMPIIAQVETYDVLGTPAAGA